jgi:transcriptional regulator with XRE-family HTH domain
MSTIILDEKSTKSVDAFSILKPMAKDSLESYVRRVMKEKKLKPGDVQRQSKGGVSDSYIGNILAGQSSNLTVDKLKALALGLGVDEDEIFDVARGKVRQVSEEALDRESFALQELRRFLLEQLNECTRRELALKAKSRNSQRNEERASG